MVARGGYGNRCDFCAAHRPIRIWKRAGSHSYPEMKGDFVFSPDALVSGRVPDGNKGIDLGGIFPTPTIVLPKST